MARQFYITPLICAQEALGTVCRPKVGPTAVNYVAACQSHTVPNAQCMVLITGDTTGADGDNTLVSLVADNMDTTISSLSNAVRNRIQNGLSSKNIPLTLTDYATVRDFLNALGKWFDPNFTIENFWVFGT